MYTLSWMPEPAVSTLKIHGLLVTGNWGCCFQSLPWLWRGHRDRLPLCLATAPFLEKLMDTRAKSRFRLGFDYLRNLLRNDSLRATNPWLSGVDFQKVRIGTPSELGLHLAPDVLAVEQNVLPSKR